MKPMKPKMLIAIFFILLVISFMPIFPNPEPKQWYQNGVFKHKRTVSLWTALTRS